MPMKMKNIPPIERSIADMTPRNVPGSMTEKVDLK
jgi:hypothetical protein